jgi:hypothetical protein
MALHQSLTPLVLSAGPPVAVAATAPLGFLSLDIEIIVALICGLLFGAMWRASDLLQKGNDWIMVRRDLLISCLAGGANAVIALGLISWFVTGPIMSMVIATLVSATGVRGVLWAQKIGLGILEQKFGPVSKLPDETR